ncbi:hypothetical protein ACFYO1_02865 [Nocardia sp. NPDC006044]|uniref:hypothetical protein n=1 Tax=Nocardia sp. NPDC006044 TaxID=3364306 RepID=UPI0036A66067
MVNNQIRHHWVPANRTPAVTHSRRYLEVEMTSRRYLEVEMTSRRYPAADTTVSPEKIVRLRAAELSTYSCTSQFDRFATQHRFHDAASFDRYVFALLDAGIVDYDALRQAEAKRAAKRAGGKLSRLAAAAPGLRLFSAATMTSFTICRTDGHLVWHDVFRRPAAIGIPASAAEASARQAIWLAWRARTHVGAPAARLRLVMADSYDITTRRLHHAAQTAGLVLELSIAQPNPAAQQRARRDFIGWSEPDLRFLFDRKESA